MMNPTCSTKEGYVSEQNTLEIRVSVDVGSHSHNVAIGLSSGEVLEEFQIARGRRALSISLAA